MLKDELKVNFCADFITRVRCLCVVPVEPLCFLTYPHPFGHSQEGRRWGSPPVACFLLCSPRGLLGSAMGMGNLLPDKLKLDWWRFLMGGGWCLEGEDLAEGAGVAYLGVAGTSYTGPSYMPLGTPCNPET